MTARESQAAAAAGAGGSAAANPIMQIRGGRGLGCGGGCALSGSGIWEKLTPAEGAGTPWAGVPHGAQLGEWKTVGPAEKLKVGHKATETSQPHFARHTTTQEKSFTPGPTTTQVRKLTPHTPRSGSQSPSQAPKHLGTHREACTQTPRLSVA